MFFNVLPGYIQGRARALSVAIVLPLALLTCGILLWFMQRMDDTRFFLFPGIAAAILYFYFNHRMNRAYVSTLLTTLKERLFLPNEQMYAALQGSSEDVLEEVLRGVRHEDNEVSVAFARLLVDSFPDRATGLILEHIGGKNVPTSDRLLRLLASLPVTPYRDQLHGLAHRGDPHLLATVLKILIQDGDKFSQNEAIGLLTSDNSRLRSIAIHAALQQGDSDQAVRYWQDLLADGTDARLAAMDLVSDLAGLDTKPRQSIIAAYRQALVALLQEPAVDTRIRALAGINDWPTGFELEVDDLLDEPLDSEYPELRTAAAGCLHLLSDKNRDRLIARALGDGHPRVRTAALESLQKVTDDFLETAVSWITSNRGNPRAQGALLDALRDLHVPTSRYEHIATRKIDEAERLQGAVNVLENAPTQHESTALQLVRHTLRERMEQTLLLALQALEPLYKPGIISTIRAGFSSGDSRHVANACEVLVNLGNRAVAGRLHDILLQSISRQAGVQSDSEFSTVNDVLNWCRQQKDDWLQHCADSALATLARGNVDA